MDKIHVNIIILPMLSYFQLLYYFINLNYFTLHYLRLLIMIILNYFWLFLAIAPYATFGYSKLLLAILAYFILSYFRLL